MNSPLTIYAGAEARKRLKKEGWHADLFSLMIGASGGPKWFVLKYLDELLFSEFLASGTKDLELIGSSIGSWRHACLVQDDPVAALDTMARCYCEQTYDSKKPSALEVSAVSALMLQEICGSDGVEHIANHPRYHSHIVTARGGNFTGSPHTPVLLPSLGLAGLANGIHRRAFEPFFQRVIFSSRAGGSEQMAFTDFDTEHVKLNKRNTAQALLASGSIPFVLAGERDIKGAPLGHYWDGGIIDYHFNLDFYQGDGLILYPHFSYEVTPGWFDKFLPWRQAAIHEIDNLVLLCPSAAFIADLPMGKIPDRSDFTHLEHDDRVRYWEQCVERSKALAQEFTELIGGSDPLRGVTVFD